MRVIGGALRGRSITAPPGRSTRPTTDRVREAIFSSVYSMYGELDGINVLDLYAGSGAMGIEALSRGATHAVFVEKDVRAARVLEGNLASLGIPSGACRVIRSDVSRLLRVGGLAPVSLLFADPPYTMEPSAEWELLEGLASADLLEPGCLVVYEHCGTGGGVPSAGFALRARKTYGDTGVTYAVYEG